MPTISPHDALPTGYRLGEFEILQVLGMGGFGIVYLAMDHALQRQVAVKEYMPSALAARGMASEVIVRSASHAETFALGLRSFVNEARLLARFDHPSLVKVYRFWEAHGTAYMVMPYYKGQTLLQVRRAMDSPPDEAWLRRLISPLLGALECLHREDVFHRDVAPDNIMLLDEGEGAAAGRPVLLDLGAARRVIGDHTHVLTAILKPSFAPIEQYAETAQLRQGPWTDLYALAAVVHYCVTGRPPMPATARAVHDELPSLRQMGPGLASGFHCHFSESFINAIDHALMVRPQDRPASIAVWRDALSGAGGAVPQGAQFDEAWPSQTVLMRPVAGETPPGHLTLDTKAFMTTVPAAGKLHALPAWPPEAPAALRAEPVSADAPAQASPAQPSPAARPSPPLTPTQVAADLMHSTMPAHRPASPAAVTEAEPEAVMSRAAMPPECDMPPTINMGSQGGARSPARPGLGADVGDASRWPLRWAFVGLALMTALAVWWQQRHAPFKPPGLSGPATVLAAERPKEPLAAPKLLGDPQTVAKLVPPASNETQGTDVQSPASGDGATRKARGAVKAERVVALREEAKAADTAGPLNPRKACGGKTFIMLAICMKRHCSRPEYEAHPACERMRQQEAAQRSASNY